MADEEWVGDKSFSDMQSKLHTCLNLAHLDNMQSWYEKGDVHDNGIFSYEYEFCPCILYSRTQHIQYVFLSSHQWVCQWQGKGSIMIRKAMTSVNQSESIFFLFHTYKFVFCYTLLHRDQWDAKLNTILDSVCADHTIMINSPSFCYVKLKNSFFSSGPYDLHPWTLSLCL